MFGYADLRSVYNVARLETPKLGTYTHSKGIYHTCFQYNETKGCSRAGGDDVRLE